MKRVYICSPYNGDVNANVLYARAAMRDSLLKGEAPFVPHLLYTQPQVLNDSVDEERKIGMKAGHSYLLSYYTKDNRTQPLACELVAVYKDRGISQGMMEDMEVASLSGIPLEFRSLKQSKNSVWAQEAQDRGITSMWLNEQDRVETE